VSDRDRDHVTEALLSDSTYERLRFSRPGFFKQPIPAKLRWQSALLVALALILPAMAAFPLEVRPFLPDGGVAFGSPRIVLLGLVAGVAVFLGGVALTVVGLLRVRLGPRMTERAANRLLNVEEVASLLGIGTGGIGVALTLAYVSLGLIGARAVTTYVETMGQNPFAHSGIEAVSVSSVATLAFVGSVALLVASQYLHLEFALKTDEYEFRL
jgi:hypothetical protein